VTTQYMHMNILVVLMNRTEHTFISTLSIQSS